MRKVQLLSLDQKLSELSGCDQDRPASPTTTIQQSASLLGSAEGGHVRLVPGELASLRVAISDAAAYAIRPPPPKIQRVFAYALAHGDGGTRLSFWSDIDD
jgi:hypothetical protein